jgi:hypothetical protein
MFINQRRRWSTKDIISLLEMKKKNMRLKEIESFFRLTVNAISKALQRYSPDYQHPLLKNIVQVLSEEIVQNDKFFHIDTAIQ